MIATHTGGRFVLAATEHLHHRIAGLSGRIRQLEDALAALQSQHSSEPHPLLHEDLIMDDEKEDYHFGTWDDSTLPFIGGGCGVDGCSPKGSLPEVVDAIGTLSISENGISRFFGPTGGSEVRRASFFPSLSSTKRFIHQSLLLVSILLCRPSIPNIVLSVRRTSTAPLPPQKQ